MFDGLFPDDTLRGLQFKVGILERMLQLRPKILIGKPGLDGHSNGAEQIACFARDAGMDVVYVGIRSTPKQLVQAAIDESVHLLGLSILSGSHLVLTSEVMELLRCQGVSIPVFVGGVIPLQDRIQMKVYGVARVYGPSDFRLHTIINDMLEHIALANCPR